MMSGSFYLTGKYATDECSKAGATKLADQIKLFWQSRGHTIRVWVEESQYSMFVVRSDLRRGRPVRNAPPKHGAWDFTKALH